MKWRIEFSSQYVDKDKSSLHILCAVWWWRICSWGWYYTVMICSWALDKMISICVLSLASTQITFVTFGLSCRFGNRFLAKQLRQAGVLTVPPIAFSSAFTSCSCHWSWETLGLTNPFRPRWNPYLVINALGSGLVVLRCLNNIRVRERCLGLFKIYRCVRNT